MSTPNHEAPYTPPTSPLDVIYQDTHLLVVNKPAGLLTVPGRGADKADCLISRVQAEFSDALIVHRLDMATSGLVVLARGGVMQSLLSQAFAGRTVEKSYSALIHGRLEGNGTVDAPLVTDWPNRPKQKIDWQVGGKFGSKPAQTDYTALAYDAQHDLTRVELKPITGRSHQLRVHMLHIGHPIVGDTLYHGAAPAHLAQRLHLHAERLSLAHPITHQPLHLQALTPF